MILLNTVLLYFRWRYSIARRLLKLYILWRVATFITTQICTMLSSDSDCSNGAVFNSMRVVVLVF